MPTHQCFVTNMSSQGYEFTIHELEGRGDRTASCVEGILDKQLMLNIHNALIIKLWCS